ncbi:CAP domain-containing protein [Tautonia plasticadhaerens]|uniref:Cysteine-rich secretory protein family protein n=1 Tax=Tautonia plasticadhaerens TaxID=2527974 RepID=A0A518HAV6_9BACT|nr:CAP domain-containing protein [Tautonia plasticadhaerens]QDV37947.1 Cysteine-rich secretory protein family protein [Tautonia plasticadhaerens]
MSRPNPSRPALVLLLVIAGCGGLPRPIPRLLGPQSPPRPSPVPADEPEAADTLRRDLLDHHNRIRGEHDLPPLTLDPKLSAAARSQALDMIELGEIRHEGADGSTPADRVRRQGYPYTNVGENVAAGQETADEVMDGWMDSPGHRKNILGDFEQMGASRLEADDGRPYWCVVFATPLPQLDPAGAATDLVTLINARRSEDSLPPMEADDALMAVARDHARAMAEAGSLDPAGPSVIEAVNEAGIGYRRLSSAVSSGPPRPPEVLDTLSDDPGRLRDLLGPFSRVGVGYATDDGGLPYWSVVFLDPPPR